MSTSTNQRGKPPTLNVERNNSMNMECDSPLMTTKNQTRKQGKLREDSCLKFKMKENMKLSQPGEGGETIDQIDSPAVLGKRGQKNPQSRFKRMVHGEGQGEE